MRPVFFPTEAAIVRIALGFEPTSQDRGLDLWSLDIPEGAVRLLPDESDNRDLQAAAGNALARMVFAGFEDQLPEFVWSTGGVVFTSRPDLGRKRFDPQRLFQINWATSGPGFTWPEVYYLCWLPVFERWVVVSARDSPDVDGYCDRLVGHFSDCEELAVEAAHVIEQYWLCLLADQQARFEEVTEFNPLIDAHAIADRVWEDCDDEEDQDADEEEDWEVCDE
jgi:hypothetical protein